MIKPNIYCLYHGGGCLDGLGAKYAMWSVYKNTANYIPVNYREPLPEGLNSESEVYILDFSYPRDVLEGLIALCKKVVILDHHKTAQEALEGIKGCHCVFDMTKSGAMLAWEYFHPGTRVPTLLAHVQDRDIWQWKMPGTKAVTAALYLLEGNMKHWESIAKNEDNEWNEWTMTRLIDSGETLLKVNDLKVKSALKKVKVLPFFGYKAGVMNSTELGSEIGEAIYNSETLGADIALVYFITGDNEVICSLRSKNEIDVSAIAKEFDGGGHKNAAGFKLPLNKLSHLLFGQM